MKLINTKADVEAACRAEQRVEGDYLDYALHHIKAAIAKRDDAPCASSEHAKAAEVALRLERKPIYREIVCAWQTDDPLLTASAPGAIPTPETNGCINCGEANDGGFFTAEGNVGPLCSQCWDFLRDDFVPTPETKE